jgi:hypothetical protein
MDSRVSDWSRGSLSDDILRDRGNGYGSARRLCGELM